MQGRASGESIRETATRLNVTDVRIRQIEAKITKKFAMSQCGRNIISKLSVLRTADELNAYAGEHYAETLHLLLLYKESFYYDYTAPMDQGLDRVTFMVHHPWYNSLVINRHVDLLTDRKEWCYL